jgi:hypothetical protein
MRLPWARSGLLLLWGGLACAAALAQVPAPDSASDRVVFSNVAPGQEWGLLVDGTTFAGSFDDRVHSGVVDAVELGNLIGVGRRELIAITRGRALELIEDVPWTDAVGDVVEVALPEEIHIPVTVWIVEGEYEKAEADVFEELVDTDLLWQDERVGLRLGCIEIVDATAIEDVESHADFDCIERAAFQEAVGRRPGRVNVYWVESVEDDPGAGETCGLGTDFIALGALSGGSWVLAHEFGHTFGWEHTDETGVGPGNVMRQGSGRGPFVTEGQTFRAHVDSGSAINSVYGARPGRPQRWCPHDVSSPACPSVATRIWPDAP